MSNRFRWEGKERGGTGGEMWVFGWFGLVELDERFQNENNMDSINKVFLVEMFLFERKILFIVK